MTSPHRPLLAVIALATIALACKAKTDDFYASIFPCTGAVPDECGTTRAGKPMTCVSAEGLGGSRFCAEACDPKGTAPLPAGYACVAAGALLQECTPNTDGGVDAAVVSCPAGLSCYRTSLLANIGVCMSLKTCSADSECGTGMVCASTVVKNGLPPSLASVIETDHLYCLTNGCKTDGMGCPTGQVCIGKKLAFGPEIDDLCAPGCDSDKDCPPNFSCLRNPETAPGSPNLCFPGLVGSRCAAAQNCLIGACTDVGVEFNVCSVPCANTKQCETLNTLSDVFVCAKNHCLTQRPFQGANCSPNVSDGATCPAGLECFDDAPYGGLVTHGECRVPCGADHKCPSRGGIPHVCLGANHDGGCYPSSFGTPCETTADCVADFQCLLAKEDSHSNTNYSPRICTMTCDTDADCDANSWTKEIGFCSDEHLCRLSAGEGRACDRDFHCISRRCDNKICVAPLL
jgi:hypothetical protein